MSKLLHVLIVEDSEDDALLLVRQLRKGGYDVVSERVDDENGLLAALQEKSWDIVITDHNMPQFSSDHSIRSIKNSGKDIPVIIVSGSIGEEVAVDAMKSGAHDYIMKDNLKRLVPAIDRELREADNRRAHREAQHKIHYMAHHDALTGVINRYGFEERLNELLALTEPDVKHGFLYIDLDQFKIVNDTCGHVAGDELLRQLAQLFKNHIRGNDTLARLGGDEFGILLENCSLSKAQQIAANLIAAVNQFQFSWSGKPFAIGTSIGLVMIDQHYHRLTDVMSAADVACYTAKDQGRNRLYVYHSDDESLVSRQNEMQWASRLHQAIEENRFRLFSQKILSLNGANKASTMFEILLRLVDEDGSLVLPSTFIPAAERYNLMTQIDRWVIDKTLQFLATDKKLENDVLVFINLSGTSLSHNDLTGYIQQKIDQYQVSPQQLCFEITETSAISNLSTALEFIYEMRNLGCCMALDDFGTGMSSFSYLRTLPVDFIKIDGEFVKTMAEDKMNMAIVNAINNIGHEAGLKTIGEYAETQQLIDGLKQLGVDYAQGFGIQHPQEVKMVSD